MTRYEWLKYGFDNSFLTGMTRDEWIEYGLEKGYLRQVDGFLLIPRAPDKLNADGERSFMKTVED